MQSASVSPSVHVEVMMVLTTYGVLRIERDKEKILVKYQDFTLITIRIYMELRMP